MNQRTIQIIISVLTILIALGIGLYFRLLLVRRLKKTVLDNWLIQLFGALVVILPLILGIVLALYISGLGTQKNPFWDGWLQDAPSGKGLPGLIWKLIGSVLIVLLAVGVGRTLTKVVTGGIAKSRVEINIRTLLGRILSVVTAIVAFFWILATWNIELTVPATLIGVVTVGITFVIQDILKNLAAGIYILIEGPFQIGDTISTDKYTGKVEAVLIRATKLRVLSGEQVIVPNALLFNGIVINNTTYEETLATIVITMPQEEYDKDKMSESILKTIKEVNGVMMKPEPVLSLSAVAGSFGGTTGTLSGYSGEIITLTLSFWYPAGQDTIVSEVMHALRGILPMADLAIRVPAGL
jgi:small-conductance mechanosensitive channel